MPPWRVATELSSEGTGPMRVRIVGDTEDLGLAEGQWDPNLGIDLCWEGDWVNGGMKLHNQMFFFFFMKGCFMVNKKYISIKYIVK